LTAAQPNLQYLSKLIGRRQVEVSDISEEYGILALQGPHSLHILQQLSQAPAKLSYFGLTETKIAHKAVIVSRTGFTGDLGYEIWVKAADALPVYDGLMEAGRGYNLIPLGMTALSMARLDAGLLLIDVDFSSARRAWVDAQRETPLELGFEWMLRNLAQDDRPFIGRRAIEAELSHRTSRWKTVGLTLDGPAYERLYNDLGLIAPKAGVFHQGTLNIYDGDWNADPSSKWIGYITSFMFSPILKKHIALGKVPLSLTKPGSEVYMELTVLHQSKYVLARVAATPFYNPARKSASQVKE
jgi:aminomethyltransferase